MHDGLISNLLPIEQQKPAEKSSSSNFTCGPYQPLPFPSRQSCEGEVEAQTEFLSSLL